MKFVITVQIELEAPQGATHYWYSQPCDRAFWYKFTPANSSPCAFDRWAYWGVEREEWMHLMMAPLSAAPVGSVPIPAIKPQTS